MFSAKERKHSVLPCHRTGKETNQPILWERKYDALTLVFKRWSRRRKFFVLGLIVFMTVYALWAFGLLEYYADIEENSRLAIFVLTSKSTFKDRGLAVIRTWGRKARSRGVPVYFASSAVPAKKYGFHTLDIPETDYEHIYQRTYLALEHFYKQGQYDWVMKVDDDTYVNIDKLLDALSTENPDDLRLLGHMDTGPITKVYSCFGGPGYILSKGLLKSVGPYLAECRLSVNSGAEDVLLADCIGMHKPDWFDGCSPFRNDVKDIVEDLSGNPVDDKLSIDQLMQPMGNVSWMTYLTEDMADPPIRIVKPSESNSMNSTTMFSPRLSEYLNAPLLERFVGLPNSNIKLIDFSSDSASKRYWHTFYNRYWSLSEAYTFHKVLPNDMYRMHHFYEAIDNK